MYNIIALDASFELMGCKCSIIDYLLDHKLYLFFYAHDIQRILNVIFVLEYIILFLSHGNFSKQNQKNLVLFKKNYI